MNEWKQNKNISIHFTRNEQMKLDEVIMPTLLFLQIINRKFKTAFCRLQIAFIASNEREKQRFFMIIEIIFTPVERASFHFSGLFYV